MLIYVLKITGHRYALHHGLNLAFVEFTGRNYVGFSDPSAYFFEEKFILASNCNSKNGMNKKLSRAVDFTFLHRGTLLKK